MGIDQLQERAADHSATLELTTAEMELYGTLKDKCDVDLTAKQDTICAEIRDMNSARLRSTNDVALTAVGGVSKTDTTKLKLELKQVITE